MKMQVLVTAVLLAVLSVAMSVPPGGTAWAASPIKGAFGYALGEAYGGDLSALTVNEDGFYEVEFLPTGEPRDFDVYLLSIAPNEGRIAQIVAAKTFATRGDAETFLFAKGKALESAHGASSIEEGAMVIEDGAKSVALSMDEQEDGGFVVAVVYQDDDLTARALLGQEPEAAPK